MSVSYTHLDVYKRQVFGNMNIFHPEENTPVGNMAKWLFDDPSNEISNTFIYQQEVPLCTYYLGTHLL